MWHSSSETTGVELGKSSSLVIASSWMTLLSPKKLHIWLLVSPSFSALLDWCIGFKPTWGSLAHSSLFKKQNLIQFSFILAVELMPVSEISFPLLFAIQFLMLVSHRHMTTASLPTASAVSDLWWYSECCYTDYPNWRQLSLVTRKPVFGGFDQVRLKPACSATETS